MTDVELAWLAGLLEGEGSFLLHNGKTPSPRVSVGMTDEDVIAKAAVLMGATYRPWLSKRDKALGRKMVYRTAISGHRAVDLMRRILPMMGLRRAAKIRELLANWRGPQRRRLTIEHGAAIARALQRGISHVELGRRMNTCSSNITGIAGRMRAKGADIPEPRLGRAIRRIDDILRLALLGRSHRSIAAEVGCSKPSVTRMLVAHRKGAALGPGMRRRDLPNRSW